MAILVATVIILVFVTFSVLFVRKYGR